MKPFLKWAGGKYRLIERITKHLPEGQRLIEPFVGAGAVFLNTDYKRYLIADCNADLINTFTVLKREKQAFIDEAKPFFTPKYNTASAFKRLREQFNTTQDNNLKAVLFVYLNKHCFNGLVRYNANGQYNVSFGRYKKPYFPELEMQYFSQKAARASIKQQDFTKTLAAAKAGDVVYCDPPYVPLSATANFTQYSAGGFDLAAHETLVQHARALACQGVTVIISNHDTPLVRQAYAGAGLKGFQVQRHISCLGDKRGKVNELLAVFT